MRVKGRTSRLILKGLLKEMALTLRTTVSVQSEAPLHVFKVFDRCHTHTHTHTYKWPLNVEERILTSNTISCAGQEVKQVKETKEPKNALFVMFL